MSTGAQRLQPEKFPGLMWHKKWILASKAVKTEIPLSCLICGAAGFGKYAKDWIQALLTFGETQHTLVSDSVELRSSKNNLIKTVCYQLLKFLYFSVPCALQLKVLEKFTSNTQELKILCWQASFQIFSCGVFGKLPPSRSLTLASKQNLFIKCVYKLFYFWWQILRRHRNNTILL